MFRKLHWVTESILPDRTSEVRGIYTSIPDLIRHGIPTDHSPFRLTLTSLDTEDGRIGTWSGPAFEGIEATLERHVAINDFTREHALALRQALQS